MKQYIALFEQFEKEFDDFLLENFKNPEDFSDEMEDHVEDDLIFSQTDNIPRNGMLSQIKLVDELNKSDHYRQRTSTPFNGEADPSSRFVPYQLGSFEKGWILDGMQKVNDQTGKPIGEIITIDKFSKEHGTPSKTIQTAITVALGELANLPWIDALKAPLGKKYLQIYMGKFGLEFKGEIYSPIFKLPDENNKYGDSFWLAASESKTESGSIEVLAKTVLVRPSTYTDEEIERDAWLSANSAISKRNTERFKSSYGSVNQYEKIPMIDERKFKGQCAVIRNTGATKQFFIIFKYGYSEKDIINSAKRAITGQDVIKPQLIHRGKPTDSKEQERSEHEPYFNLEKGSTLVYYNTNPNNKKLKIESWNNLTIVDHIKPKVGDRNYKVTVKTDKGESVMITIQPGDKVKVIRNRALRNFTIGVTDTGLVVNKNRIKLAEMPS